MEPRQGVLISQVASVKVFIGIISLEELMADHCFLYLY